MKTLVFFILLLPLAASVHECLVGDPPFLPSTLSDIPVMRDHLAPSVSVP